MNSNLATRMSEYESHTTSIKLIKRLPIVVRLDAKSFGAYTKGLKRPYDIRLSRLMIETAKYLMRETNANIAHTGSDEINLLYYTDTQGSELFLNGRLFKMQSLLAAMATAFFNNKQDEYLPEKKGKMPIFDCRVFNVPDVYEAANYFLSREMDVTRNSISMAAETVYSHTQILNKTSKEKQEMLFQKGINWNEYDTCFKRGTYIQRKRTVSKFTTEDLEKLPVHHQARKNPELEVERWLITELNMPPLIKVQNRHDVIVFGEEPILATVENEEEVV